jgi:hypothetical protein
MTALTKDNKVNLHGFHAGRLIYSQCNNWIGELIVRGRFIAAFKGFH